MIPPANFSDLYDFSAIERAVQSYFVASGLYVAPPDENDADREAWTTGPDSVAFFTAFEAAIFQRARPRVACFLSGINPATTPIHGVVDGNGAIRNSLWKANLMLEIITDENYTRHTAMRSQVAAIAEMLAPMVSDSSVLLGVNQYLTNHHISYVLPQNHDTQISVGEGFYGSQLNYQITFCVPPGAVAAVTE